MKIAKEDIKLSFADVMNTYKENTKNLLTNYYNLNDFSKATH